MREAVLRSSSIEMICTGMCRVSGSSLRLLSTVQPSMSGRKISRVMAVGRYWRASDERLVAAHGDEALESLVPRQAEQHARVMRIVLDDQQDRDRRPSTLSRSSCDALFARRPAAREQRGRQGMRSRGAGQLRRSRPPGRAGPGVVQRQVERERAAFIRHAGQPDLAAEQRGQFARDGEAQAGAAVFARGAGVRLLERLEDEPLLFRRDADAGVA